MALSQAHIDAQNADFWNELCGTNMARSAGITEHSGESLRKFDAAYLAFYPYLEGYVSREDLPGKRVLEIGLGYGTLGQLLASKGCQYYGLDIASNPVAIMRYRLSLLQQDNIEERVQEGSVLDIPHKDNAFDYVYSIGCLHHTGDLPRAVSEIYRVLVPGGKAIIMLYNRYSMRRLVKVPLLCLQAILSQWSRSDEKTSFSHRVRALYDFNEQGKAAPHTDYVSRTQVRSLFRNFRQVLIDSHNCDTYVFMGGRWVIPRERLLNNLGRVLGLDLYIQAYKSESGQDWKEAAVG